MTILYFSATGNCLSVAKTIGGTLHSIPQLARDNVQVIEDDCIGIVAPVYAFGLPRPVAAYLATVTLKATYIFGVLTYGNSAGGASIELQKVLVSNGNRLDFAKDVLMVDNYLPIFKVENQLAKLPKKNIEGQLTELCQQIAARQKGLPPKNPLIKMITGFMSKGRGTAEGQAAIHNTDTGFSITDACVSCGICAKVCPANNITVQTKPVFSHRCESCFACIHNCPKTAIQLKGQKSTARFRNPNVTVQELMQANETKRS